MDDAALTIMLERVWARDAVAMASALSAQDPTWGTETLAVAGGQLVLSGRGMYVNRAIAVGIDPALRPADIGLIDARSTAAGVPAAVEVTPATHAESRALLTAYGFVHDEGRDVRALVRPLTDLPAELSRPGITVMPVSERSLDEWRAISALGFGHATPETRRASDAFARAAHVVDGDGMVIAVDSEDGRPLGCASMTINATVATLGGMSTIPAERGRGVQATLILHRLGVAREAGCSLAAATTVVGGDSERNVQRYGFRPLHVKQTRLHQ